MAFEVNILDAEAEALDQAQAGAKDEFGDELVSSGESGDDSQGLFSGEDGRQVMRFFGSDDGDVRQVYFEHVAVEKEDGAEGLVLGRGGDVFVHSEVGEKGFDLWYAH